MVCGPEIARAITEFETTQPSTKLAHTDDRAYQHHEQVTSVQQTFQKQVGCLIDTIETMGNPFLESGDDLLVLDTKEIASEKVVATVNRVKQVGKEHFEAFVEERIVTREKAISDVIKLNKSPLFSSPRKSPGRKNQNVTSLKENCSLFSQLYISCQVRQGNLEEFFAHENQAHPPSISKYGELRLGAKSDLLKCLESLSAVPTAHPVVVIAD
jgi:hypothetical protein